MSMCKKCGMWSGVSWLFFGLVFLVSNLTSWNFWGIEWYTVAFLLLGLSCWGKSSCKSCK